MSIVLRRTSGLQRVVADYIVGLSLITSQGKRERVWETDIERRRHWAV